MIHKDILKGVSRSFYLSIKFLPRTVRIPVGLAFLACKAADTITDTKLIPRDRRLEMLQHYRSLFNKPDEAFFSTLAKEVATNADNPLEQKLLTSFADIFDSIEHLPTTDKLLLADLVRELTQGMIQDLTHFPGETSQELRALDHDHELDQYTYYVAGCVGLFWTRMLRKHFKFAHSWNQDEMESMGEKFGKGLQMVNILRDLPRDLQNGRCYVPAESLRQWGLEPHHLLDPKALPRIKPYLQQLLSHTQKLLHCARPYAAAHPSYAIRLKWVILLPMQLGFKTLDRLEKSDDWLNPQTVIKVPRSQVYRSMLSSAFRAMIPAPGDVETEHENNYLSSAK